MNVFAFILTLALPVGLLTAAPVHFRSSEPQTPLLELYTSEGCSSCPPADKWIAKLKTDKRLWKEVVPVVFHVDYWDHLGWKDRFGSSEFSRRQRDHARAWGSGRVYTPGFVLNGKEWRGFFLRRDLPDPLNNKTGALKATRGSDGSWRAVFTPAKDIDKNRRWTLHAALLGAGLRSEVKSGENRGRTLRHDFTALAFTKRNMKSGTNGWSAEIRLKPKERHDAGKLAAAFWICPTGGLRPVQAVGGWLPAEQSPGRKRE